jgi:hypothetical protein
MDRRDFLAAAAVGGAVTALRPATRAALAAPEFITANGGALAPTVDEIAAMPLFDTWRLQRPLASPSVAVPDYLDAYNAAYWPQDQGPTGCCTGCATSVAMQACSLNVQGAPMPALSWGYAYYANTHDATFSVGSSVYGSVLSCASTNGDCADMFYSQAFVLAHWQGRGAYPPSYLPQPPAYTDGAQRQISTYGALVSTQIQFIPGILRSGYPIAVHYGDHAICLISVASDNYWCYGMDSELGNQNLFGFGPGVRPMSLTDLQSASEFVVVSQVGAGPPTFVQPDPPLTTSAQIVAAMQAGAGTWTAADIAAFRAEVDALSPLSSNVVNGSFETPTVPTYQYNPTGGTWAFNGSSGISGSGSGFTSTNPEPPDGTQVAFIQNGGTISQLVSVPSAGQYQVGFYAAQRANYQFGAQIVTVKVDGVTIGQYQPPNTSYAAYHSPPVTLSAGAHTVALVGTGSGSDYTALVDAVTLSAQ